MASIRLVLLTMIPAIGLIAQGCNPEAAAMDIFRKQGLVVLKPARDYIKVGGLVSIKDNTPVYREPADDVPADPNVATKFNAIIMEESAKKAVGFGVALKAIGSIVPIPVTVNAGLSNEVSLAQIDTTGVRLVADAVDAQILKKNTAAKARDLLGRGSKVYIVQEVYFAKSMQLTASGKSGFDVSLGSGGAVTACATEEDAKKEGEKKEGEKKEGEKKPEAKEAETKKAEAKKEETKKAETKKAETKKPETKKEETNKETEKADTAASAKSVTPSIADLSLGVKVCKSGSMALKFQADSSIPFAVRLAEIELSNKQLRIKEGKFKFATSLGTSRVEKITSTQVPVLASLQFER